MRNSQPDKRARLTTLRLLFVGTVCTFAGLILLTLINAAIRVPPAAGGPQISERRARGENPDSRHPADARGHDRFDSPLDPKKTREPDESKLGQASELVQPRIGSPIRSEHRAERRARRITARTGVDLIAVAAPGPRGRTTWQLMTADPMRAADAHALCQKLQRQRTRCR